MADDDIFMDYAASSPIEVEIDHAPNLKFNIPKLGNNFENLTLERGEITQNLKNHFETGSSTNDTRLKILQLRQFNRHMSNAITEHRKMLNELKEIIDNLNNKLLCQKFEKQNLLDEIKTSLDSKNIYQSIDLELIEEEMDSDQHEVMIRRLQGELAKRQELQTQLSSILQRKQETEANLDKKKKKIEDLRVQLQNLLKTSKPLIEATGFDLEALHKKKMNVDDFTESESVTFTEDLSAVYEKLITFVVDKPEYKLRFFDTAVQENGDDLETTTSGEEGRNSSIKSPYIQIKVDFSDSSNELEPFDIFLKLQQNESSVSSILFTIHHELIPESSVSNWLKGLGSVEFDIAEYSNWLIPTKIQPDSLNFVQDASAFEQVFTAIKDALLLRCQLLSIVQSNDQMLEFDKNNISEISFIPSNSLKARISMNSIVWIETDNSKVQNEELISALNSIGSKYRSVLDCLQAQLEILLK